MSPQHRSIDSSEAWVHPPRQNETTQLESYQGVEGRILPGSQPDPSAVAQHQDLPLPLAPLRRRDASPRFGFAYPSQSPPLSCESNLPSRPAAPIFGRPSPTLIDRQPSQSFTSSASCFANTPTLRVTTNPATQSLDSPFPSEPLPHRQISQSYTSDRASQPHTPPTYANPSSTRPPSSLQTNYTPNPQPFLTGRATPMKRPGSRQTDRFVAIDPFRASNNQTRPYAAEIIPSSYDDIPVPHQGPWPTWQLNNCTSPYPPIQQHHLQQDLSSTPPNSHHNGPYPPDVGQRPYLPSSHYHAPQHQNTSSRPLTPPQTFEPPTTYPPAAIPDPWNGNATTPPDPQESHSTPPSPSTSESFHWHCATEPTAPSAWSRPLNYVLQPFRHDGGLQEFLAVSWKFEKPDFSISAVDFVVKTIPRQVYLHMLLHLPSLYFSRVARIFEEADLTLPEIKKMALETATEGRFVHSAASMTLGIVAVPPAYQRLKTTWEGFIDSTMREWKISNIISVLLLSAILTILQIQSAADDPVTRYTALFSLICGLISLLFGCMYIVRFSTMRRTYKAAEWALEAKRTKTVVWWNVWVLLAMPAVWLTWSLVLYIACIMSFVWRTRPHRDSTAPQLSDGGVLAMRIIITTVLGIGLIYGCLIVSTFRRYGSVMDKAWKDRIDGWLCERAAASVRIHADRCSQYSGYGQPQLWQARVNQDTASDNERPFYGVSEYSARTDPYHTPYRSRSPSTVVGATRTPHRSPSPATMVGVSRANALYSQTSTLLAAGSRKRPRLSGPPPPHLVP